MATGRKSFLGRAFDAVGRWMADRLNSPLSGYEPYTPSDFETLSNVLEVGDVVLVEGGQRVSAAIKYLTQSSWSHAALYVGDSLPAPTDGTERPRLVEVNLGEGCVGVPLTKYATHNTRICRPVGLSDADRAKVARYMIDRIGVEYDMRNIFDLARYFLPTPPVPVRWRRRMLSIGSGDPTRAICSSLIAQAFQSVRYPILPNVKVLKERMGSKFARREIYHIRHHSLFAPRDFDLSPYFEIVKPTLMADFDPAQLSWARDANVAPANGEGPDPTSA